MTTLWIGDFRTKQLQLGKTKSEYVTAEYSYLVDDWAEYSWFVNNAAAQIPMFALDSANIVIMLGFNDCVYSCVWKSFDIGLTAAKYAKAINELVDQYPSFNFYVCSVNPVAANYPFAESTNGIVVKALLNATIKQFNSKIEKTCRATYIDSFSYLISTSFDTIDGTRFTPNTCSALQNYIASFLTGTAGATVFSPRTVAPHPDDDSFTYWLSVNKGGYNTYGEMNTIDGYKNIGSTLPNCTAYAWGRFYEIIGEKPKLLSLNNAEEWFLADGSHSFGNDGYKRGSIPALGAVICWSKGNPDGTTGGAEDGAGHVAIVEQINADGSIVTSESGYGASKPWYSVKRVKGTDNNWGQSSAYKFQGFIYCPTTTAIGKEELYVGDNYLSKQISPPSSDVETKMKPTVRYIWQFLGARGWTMNAVAALCGNLHEESTMSPGQWEKPSLRKDPPSYYIEHYGNYESPVKKNSDGTFYIDQNAVDKITTALGRSKNRVGYGLVQWTPYTKYINWCSNGGSRGNANGSGGVLPFWDIDSQLKRIEAEADVSDKSWVEGLSQWIAKPSKGYDLSFKDFITSTKDAYWLAGAFAFCYERPGRSTGTEAEQLALRKERGEYAQFWYDYLSTLAPIAADTSLKVCNFKIDTYEPTKISASFVIRNGSSGTYTLSKHDEPLQPKSVKTADGVQQFDIKSDIVPHTEYKLKLEIHGTDGKNFSDEIPFTTPQDYPDPPKYVKLSHEGSTKSVDGLFTLKVTQPDYLGYWSKNSCGYEKQLFVNGKCVKTKTIKNVKDISESFTIKKEFGYECKTGDNIQIGIRVWVKDDDGVTLYDGPAAKTSEAICLLNRPVITYLKLD